jgi:hypothetical protein
MSSVNWPLCLRLAPSAPATVTSASVRSYAKTSNSRSKQSPCCPCATCRDREMGRAPSQSKVRRRHQIMTRERALIPFLQQRMHKWQRAEQLATCFAVWRSHGLDRCARIRRRLHMLAYRFCCSLYMRRLHVAVFSAWRSAAARNRAAQYVPPASGMAYNSLALEDFEAAGQLHGWDRFNNPALLLNDGAECGLDITSEPFIPGNATHKCALASHYYDALGFPPPPWWVPPSHPPFAPPGLELPEAGWHNSNNH